MKRSLINIIKEEINEWNSIEQKIPIENYKLFTLEDFDYLIKYYKRYGDEFNTTKFIDFCSLYVLKELASSSQKRSIWYWEDIDEDFIIPQFNYLSSLIKAYIELKDNQEYEVAYIIFRSFIEVSTQFYACFLDLEFFKKYLSEDIQEEYRKHWFKHLKPKKVISVLRRLKIDLNTERKRTGNYSPDLRDFIYPFESELRSTLYENLSSFTHGKYKRVNYEMDQVEIMEFNWRITEYLVSSISLLNSASEHFLIHGHFDTRKHVILQQIWYSIKYKSKHSKT